MANTEAPNTLLSNNTISILDLCCSGPISGFVVKPGPYGNDPLCATLFDGIPVRNATDGSYNFNVSGQGFRFEYALGSGSQSGIPGFQKVENFIPLNANTRVANPPAGGGPWKPVIASISTNTYPDADSVKITVRVPALFAQDNDGNTNPFEIVYAVDISMNGGLWVPQPDVTIRGKCTSTYQKTTVYQLPKTVPAESFYEWKVRVRRVSQNILSIKTQNELYVDSISVISSNRFAYPRSVIVGTQISADQFGTIPTRAYELAGLLVNVPSGYIPTRYSYVSTPFVRLCDMEVNNKHIGMSITGQDQLRGIIPGISFTGLGIPANSTVSSTTNGGDSFSYFSVASDEVGPTITANNVPITFFPTEQIPTITPAVYPDVWLGNYQSGVWTDNPAWIFNDLITNPVHGLGDYIGVTSVDKWALYQIAQYCDQMVDDGAGGLEPNFTCNVQIQQPDDAYNVLLNLASTFRGMVYYANGTIHATQTSNKVPIYAFTNANVVAGQFSYSDTAQSTRATVAMVKWLDPNNNYRETVERIEDTEGILRYGYNEKQMTAFACTSKGQAYRLGRWTLETERLLTETITFQTSLEGLSIQPGDAFAVYDNFRNNRSQGGRILGFDSGRSLITLDRSVTIDPGYVYSLSAIVPKFMIDESDVTGSNQIDLMRQSQIETFRVVTPINSTTNQLLISGQFSTGLFVGSPWVLAASGNSNVFQNASFYTCLATAEIEPGKIEILGLEANTGINFVISTGYTTSSYPVNAGDNRSIQPPSNLFATGITGQTAENAFYSTIRLTWVNTPSPDLSYYVVSGKTFNGAYERAIVIDTGYNFTRSSTGQYLFSVAAVSLGGVESSYITGGYLITTQNPLGTLKQLSGVQIIENFDPLYSTSSGYTGYIGVTPTFGWSTLYGSNGLPIVDYQFISGYLLSFKSFDGTDNYTTPFTISGSQTNRYQLPSNLIYSFSGGPRRGFDFKVDIVDIYGNVFTGASLPVNNPTMKPPFSSGFVGFNGGISYNVTPSLQYDTSGIYIWMNRSTGFIPTYDNASYSSTNLAGTAPNSFMTGFYWIWFALTDTFGRSGNAIYGPISGSADGIFQTFNFDITNQISGAFSLLTGLITDYISIVSGQNALTAQSVFGLSGQITGLNGIPGAVNTALNVRTNTIVVGASGVLSTQINAVQASVDSVSATVGTLSSALATTGGALASWITNLGAVTSGQNASVQIGAQAFVTGSVNGLGGAAVATWGFRLNANGQVVSMQATASNTFGQSTTGFGNIVFGGANLQSENYVAGSAGWRLTHGGNFEGNNGVFRGTLAVSSGSDNEVIIGTNSLGVKGLNIGQPGSSFGWVSIAADADVFTPRSIRVLNPSNNLASVLGYNVLGGGYVSAYNGAGSESVHMRGTDGWISATGSIYVASTTFGAPTAFMRRSDGLISGRAGRFNGSLTIDGDSNNIFINNGAIQKVSPGGWGPYLYDGSNLIEFRYSGTAFLARINSSTVIQLN